MFLEGFLIVELLEVPLLVLTKVKLLDRLKIVFHIDLVIVVIIYKLFEVFRARPLKMLLVIHVLEINLDDVLMLSCFTVEQLHLLNAESSIHQR